MSTYRRILIWVCMLAGVVLLCAACNGGDANPFERSCDANSDCNVTGGEQCINGTCQFPAQSTAECTSDIDCPAGEYCTAAGECEARYDGDVDDVPFECPEPRICISDRSCLTFGTTYACIAECCMDTGQPVFPDGDGSDGDTPDGDSPDGDQPEDCTVKGCPDHFSCNLINGVCEPDDTHCQNAGCEDRYSCDDASGLCEPGTTHCKNDPCDNLFVCNETSGLCEPDVGNCLVDGCPDNYTCTDSDGGCDPGPDHCLNNACAEHFTCEEETGDCVPGETHCDSTGCGNYFDCNLGNGLCEPNAEHCNNTPCAGKFRCAPDTGVCMPGLDHCDITGCEIAYSCNTSGDCEPGPEHCVSAGCSHDYVCNTANGRCEPNSSQRSACSGDPDCENSTQYCIGGGDWLCDCDGSLEVVDCASYCREEGYPIFAGCDYYTDTNTPSNSRYRCDCDTYGTTAASCSAPVVIDRLPYANTYDVIGAANTLHAVGCDQLGSGVPGYGGYERIYALEAVQGDRFRIRVEIVLGNPYVTIRNACTNDTDWCKHAEGTGFLGGEDISVQIPATGAYYISVESDSPLTAYKLYVDML